MQTREPLAARSQGLCAHVNVHQSSRTCTEQALHTSWRSHSGQGSGLIQTQHIDQSNVFHGHVCEHAPCHVVIGRKPKGQIPLETQDQSDLQTGPGEYLLMLRLDQLGYHKEAMMEQ